MRAYKPTILHLNSSKVGALGAVIGRMLKVKKLFTAHGWAYHEERGRVETSRMVHFIHNKSVSTRSHRCIKIRQNDSTHCKAQKLF